MIGHVFKYEIPVKDEIIEIQLPEHYKFCDIQAQGDGIFMWCMVDIHAPLITKRFRVFGTGHKIFNAENHLFIKTVQLNHMPLVFHIFEVME
jgi:hypothetical protein